MGERSDAVNLAAIRIKCAEIVGWTSIENLTTGLRGKPPNNSPFCTVPTYVSSADAALQLVEWMRKPENGKHTWSAATSNQHGVPCIAFAFCREIMHKDPNVQPFSSLYFTGNADTFALAVCLAFLKANNIEPETL